MADKNLVILHGWQSKIQRWQPLVKILSKNFNVYLPSLPGFGKKKLNKVWDLSDYADWLADYLKKEKNKKILFLSATLTVVGLP